MTHNLVPMVEDGAEQWGRSYDIYSMLLKNRIVFLGMPINQEISNVVVAQILYLDSQSPGQPIHLYINSPGGEVYAGFAMYDAMQMATSPVYTYAVGMTASMGTAILAAGASGHRYALPHATIHMHPTSSGMKGYTEDVQIALREQERLQTQMFHILGKHTGHTWQEIERDFNRDRFMHSLEAKEYGLIDHILGNSSDVILRLTDGSIGIAGLSLAGLITSNSHEPA
ncbi:MAG: ATP-dependent Clp protease proteolytic subunit [Caldilineaceae bacterium]|nr:ATP-dependent Clp protease proteolytic subunit [Caldilineaceae bacterium]